MRLDKFLSKQLGLSRSLISKEIRAGKAKIDDEIVKNGAHKLTSEMKIQFEECELQQIIDPRYFMLHKPVGYVCSTKDPLHPSVLYLLRETQTETLHPVGRLDLDTTGLVLITDDGKWSHRMTSPKYRCTKTYFVTLAEPISFDCIPLFAQGILLRGDKKLTRPAILEIEDEKQVRLTITEGRYHQVKRMFAAVGNHVVHLHRERIGAICLDSSLKPGDYRALTETEIKNNL